MAADPSDSLSRRSLRTLARIAGLSTRDTGVQGFVDALVSGDTVVGWARDPRDPARRLEIQVLHGKKVMGFGIADIVRKDLLAQNMGDGRYGFRLRLAPVLLDGAARTITVCAVTERGKVPLQRGELTVAARPQASAAALPPSEPLAEPVNVAPVRSSGGAAPAMVGALERLNGRALQGWAFNPDHPEAPALVDVYDDERYLGSVMADRSRPRLYEKGFPSGARGFVFELPVETEEAASGRLRARVAGTAYDLRRSRDFAAEAAPPATPAREAEALPPADQPPPSEPPRATEALEPAVRRRPVRGDAPDDGIVALWMMEGGTDGATTLADWSGQRHPAVRVATRGPAPDLPERLGRDPIALGGKNVLHQLAREADFVLFAAAGVRLDAEVAGSLAALPRFPDVVVMNGERPFWRGEAARIETFLAPVRLRPTAVRADVLAAYPGDLRREIERGMLSPLFLWLAARRDLIWTTLAAPGATAVSEPNVERRDRLWRAMLDPQAWTVTGATLQPNHKAERISIALWQGWDDPALPALQALATDVETPLDVLVPAEGDEARAHRRLAAAEQALATAGAQGPRARIVDCRSGDLHLIRAMLDAADGDAILLTDGAARLAPGDLVRMAQWSLHADCGPVGLKHASGWSSGALLAAGPALRPASDADGADLVSFGLAMIATAHVAAVGLPDPIDGDLGHAALGWTRRMARNGFHAAMLSGGAAMSDAPAEPPYGPLPWQVEARLRACGLLEAQ